MYLKNNLLLVFVLYTGEAVGRVREFLKSLELYLSLHGLL